MSTNRAHTDTDYRLLFDSAPDAIILFDEHGRCTDVNRAACELTGLDRASLLRSKLSELVCTECRQPLDAQWEQLRLTGRLEYVMTLVRPDGARLPVELRAADLGNGLYHGVIRDISSMVEQGGALQRSVNAFGTLVRICHAAVISADADGRINSWNPAAEALFGYTAEEAAGLDLTKLIPAGLRGKHRAGFRRQVRAAEETGPCGLHIRSKGIHKDGSEVHVEVSVASGLQGDEVVSMAVVRDISEHQEVLERLNDALQRLQFHVERMPLAYIVWDADFRAEEWNPAAQRIFGYTKAEAIGRHAYDLVVPPDVVPAVDTIWAKLLAGDVSSHSINENVRKDGTRLTCEWFNTPLRDSAGRIRRVACMAMDVTERELNETQFRNAQRLEGLGVLASGVAHDFNSFLMVILGNTTLLRNVKGLPAKALEHIDPIEAAGSRAGDLIRHLLAYARTGRHNPQPTNINDVIDGAVNFVVASVGPEAKLDLSLSPRLPTILADRGQLEQILLNLCLNAKQAMERPGTISVSTRQVKLTRDQVARCTPHEGHAGTYVELSVADTGCGIDEPTAERIFDPFFTTKTDGHGLGLAAVLGILRQHNGMARVESEVGRGTRIRVYFPVHQDASDEPPHETPAHPPA